MSEHCTAEGVQLWDPPIYDSASRIIGGTGPDDFPRELRGYETVAETVARIYGETYGAYTLGAISAMIVSREASSC